VSQQPVALLKIWCIRDALLLFPSHNDPAASTSAEKTELHLTTADGPGNASTFQRSGVSLRGTLLLHQPTCFTLLSSTVATVVAASRRASTLSTLLVVGAVVARTDLMRTPRSTPFSPAARTSSGSSPGIEGMKSPVALISPSNPNPRSSLHSPVNLAPQEFTRLNKGMFERLPMSSTAQGGLFAFALCM
jgi:hypothetical protein